MARSPVIILDFGSQYTQLIARRVRELQIFCEIQPCTMALPALRALQPAAVILSGGPASVTTQNSPRAPQAAFELGVPILGICYGQQTLSQQQGGEVEGGHAAEFGRADVEILETSPLFDGFWEVGLHSWDTAAGVLLIQEAGKKININEGSHSIARAFSTILFFRKGIKITFQRSHLLKKPRITGLFLLVQ